jgi:NTE family protein
MDDKQKFADLVFEGGGVKGIGLVGAYAELERQGYAPQGVAGTSAGAITAALVAAGYRGEQLEGIVLSMPFEDFRDPSRADRMPLVGPGLSVLLNHGIYRGEFFRAWMQGELEKQGITRFGQLRNDDAEDEGQRYRLRVIASDLTHRRMLVLPNDAGHLGIAPDELEIAYAVRMSMSIPIFFEPVVHKNPQNGEEHVIVDGGVLSNFPVWLFDCQGRDPRWPTFGVRLVEPEPRKPIGHRLSGDENGFRPGSLATYIKSLAQTMMEAHDRQYLDQATFARTIPIPTLGVRTTEFDISEPRRTDLYNSGREAAAQFLEHFDFAEYVAAAKRRDEQYSRSEAVAVAMSPDRGRLRAA